MMFCRRFIYALILCLFSFNAFSLDIHKIEVTAGTLNVRNLPSLSGHVIAQLKKGDRTLGVYLSKNWMSITLNGKLSGYVHDKYIKILPKNTEIPTLQTTVIQPKPNRNKLNYSKRSSEVCDSNSANLTLDIYDTKLQCEKSPYIGAASYRSCDAHISIHASASCPLTDGVVVDCTAIFREGKGTATMFNKYEKIGSDTVYLNDGQGYATVTVTWDIPLTMDNVTFVKLENIQCNPFL